MVGFGTSLMLFSCNDHPISDSQIESVFTENRVFCSPAGGSNCDPPETHSTTLTVDGCQIKVNFKSVYCRVGLNNSKISVYDFSIDWLNSIRCNKIGLMNDAMPINGIGDWTPFFILYNDLFRNVSRATELFILDFYGSSETEDHIIDWWESHCQKACYTPILDNEDPENPQIPQWTFHTCSTDGCCFRNTIYVYNPVTKKFEIHLSWINPEGLCDPEIPINCNAGSSECKEPCQRL
jgi:hypothetical protein